MSAVQLVLGSLAGIFFCFTFVLLFGAPFLPTLRPQIDAALDLLDLSPGEMMLELGCGDGRVLSAAARRGIRSVGYELNPILVFIARLRTRRYGEQVSIVWGDYWRSDWPPAQGIFAFILPRYMGKLHKKIMRYTARPLRVASFAFEIPKKQPYTSTKGIFLYMY